MAHHLLIVDDEEGVLRMLEDLFGRQGHTVSTSIDGEQALKLLEDITPDLILADYRMPGMDGVEFLKATQARCPDAIRILFTAHGDLNVAVAAINEASVYKLITKPWNNNNLTLTIRRALEHYDLIKQNRAFADTLELMVEENTEEIERLRQGLHEMALRIRNLLPRE